MKQITQIIPSTWWHFSLLVAIAIIGFFPFLGSVHLFDWDEINFAEAAREMLITGEYGHVQINFEPFYEKPPLFFWLQASCMQIWGINEFAARFPNALFAIFTLLTLYFIGKREIHSRFGLLWALMHFSALLPHFYFKTGIIDPVFNYFIFLGIYSLVMLFDKPYAHTKAWAWIGGLSIGLAILTKGPVGALIPGLVVLSYWIKSRLKSIISWQVLSVFSVAAIIPPLAWLGYETYHHSIDFIKNFIIYQIELFNQPVAGHSQPFYYHFVVVFLGCFPASILAISSLFKPALIRVNKIFPIMKMLFLIVMGLFSLSTTKIVHYSSMSYFPISFMAAYYLYQIDQEVVVASRIMQRVLWTIGCVLAFFFTALPIVVLHKNFLSSFINDSFTLAIVEMPVPWRIQDCVVGISYLLFNLIACYFFNKRTIMLFASFCAVATTCCLTLGALQIIPKIEMHIQRPAIDFCKNLIGKRVYVTTVGFKSYAPLFYFQQPADIRVRASELLWLMTGQLDHPAYFIAKITDTSKLLKYPMIKLLYVSGGFAFFKREMPV